MAPNISFIPSPLTLPPPSISGYTSEATLSMTSRRARAQNGSGFPAPPATKSSMQSRVSVSLPRVKSLLPRQASSWPPRSPMICDSLSAEKSPLTSRYRVAQVVVENFLLT